jgi:pyruvate,water dikinase
LYRVLRVYALRAAELTGVGADIFYLSLEEVAALLAGDRAALGYIESRRETDRRYRSLPPYPAIIRGRFDAQRWAQDPRRRSDIFDPAQETISSDAVLLEGFPGSPGVVEAFARVLQNPAQGATFQAGEILVANTTNVGWTPLFPRAAAIVTDIGAPLSHAAIVARELGIPAVVGTGSATTRLRTGDRLRVNGGKGTVEILET